MDTRVTNPLAIPGGKIMSVPVVCFFMVVWCGVVNAATPKVHKHLCFMCVLYVCCRGVVCALYLCCMRVVCVVCCAVVEMCVRCVRCVPCLLWDVACVCCAWGEWGYEWMGVFDVVFKFSNFKKWFSLAFDHRSGWVSPWRAHGYFIQCWGLMCAMRV